MQASMLLVVGFFGFILASIDIQSQYTWLDEKCLCSWSVIRSVSSLDTGPIGCAAYCISENGNCRGFMEENGTCDLVHIAESLLCLDIPIRDIQRKKIKLQTFKHQPSQRGLYLALPQVGKAFALSNMKLPDILIPSQPELMEMTIRYKEGILGCSGDRKCWFWQYGLDEWQSFASPQTNHYLGKMVLLDDKPLLIGGCGSGEKSCLQTDKVEVFEESDSGWHFKTSLPRPNRSFIAVVVNNGTKVIVVSGIGSPVDATNQVMSYELTTNVWLSLNPLPEMMCCHIGTQVTLPDNRLGILIIGGLNSRFRLEEKAYFFDLTTMLWERLISFDTIGSKFYEGDMFFSDGQLFIIPNYEDAIRKDATKILSRDMMNANAPWISHDMSAKFKLGKITQIALEVREYPIQWIPS